MVELKPCPFCGCKVKFDTMDSLGVRIDHPKTECIGYRMCRSIITHSRNDREWLINGWNNRTDTVNSMNNTDSGRFSNSQIIISCNPTDKNVVIIQNNCRMD